MTRLLLAFSLAASALAPANVAARAPAQAPPLDQRARNVYVSATDSNGIIVTDLTVADFAVKDGGKTADVVRGEPATAPMSIAILIDDNGTGLFRYGVGKFIQRLQGRAEFALFAVTGQTMKLVDYTANVDALSTAIGQIAPRPGTPDGGQLLEGIFETAKDLQRREARRPVIVVLTVGGEEHSSRPAHQVLDQVRQSGASLHVVSVAASALRSLAAVTKPSALLEENMNLNEVLGDGPKQSGGRREEIVASAGVVLGLQQLAESLAHEYVVSYVLPEGVKPSGRVNVSVKRKGISLRAPTQVPSR